jgi:hypothetical protein
MQQAPVTLKLAAAPAATSHLCWCKLAFNNSALSQHAEAQLPDADGYYDPDMDPWERAFDYKFNQVLRESALPGEAPAHACLSEVTCQQHIALANVLVNRLNPKSCLLLCSCAPQFVHIAGIDNTAVLQLEVLH